MPIWKFSACGYALQFDQPEQTALMIRNAGFCGIEGNDEIVRALSDSEIGELSGLMRRNGVPFTSFHLPFSAEIDVASFYETDRRSAVGAVEAAMRRASVLGVDTVILHPTTSHRDVHMERADRYLDQISKSVESLAESAERLELRIAIENMMDPKRDVYFSKPEHITGFTGRFDHATVGFCLDTGHALITMGPERQLEIMDAMGMAVFAYHLQDNPGDRDLHLAPGLGRVDFAGVFTKSLEIGFTDAMCIEAPPDAPEQPYSEDSWRALQRSVTELAESAVKRRDD